jgi:hypothetical protein
VTGLAIAAATECVVATSNKLLEGLDLPAVRAESMPVRDFSALPHLAAILDGDATGVALLRPSVEAWLAVAASSAATPRTVVELAEVFDCPQSRHRRVSPSVSPKSDIISLTAFLHVTTHKFLGVFLEDGVDLVQQVVDILGDLLVALGDLGVGLGCLVDLFVPAGTSGL